MSDYSTYAPASLRRRFGAFAVNITLLTFIELVLKHTQVSDLSLHLPFALTFLFSVFFDSPGTRIFDLAFLDEAKRPLEKKARLYRNSPFIVFYLILLVFPFSKEAGDAGKIVIGLLWLLSIVFIFADLFPAIFMADGRSLLDITLRTRVYAPSFTTLER